MEPRFTGFAGDVAITVEDGVCELGLAQILPDVLGAVAFGRIARQPQKRDVRGHAEALALVVACSIEKNGAMSLRVNGLADGIEMQVHHGGIGFGHDDGSAQPPARTGGSEQRGPIVALVARRQRPGSAPGPNPRQGAFVFRSNQKFF